jgi:hypothetical protein
LALLTRYLPSRGQSPGIPPDGYLFWPRLYDHEELAVLCRPFAVIATARVVITECPRRPSRPGCYRVLSGLLRGATPSRPSVDSLSFGVVKFCIAHRCTLCEQPRYIPECLSGNEIP